MANIFITGASTGIGKAFVELASESEHTLVITARSIDKLDRIKKELEGKSSTKAKIITRKLDVSNKEEVKSVVEEVTNEIPIDTLINNAGLAMGQKDRIENTPVDFFDIMIDTNIKGLLYVTRHLLPTLLAQKSAHIINIGSIAGVNAYGGGSVYCATKAAVRFLSDGLRIELVDRPVRVTNIQPGIVKTNFSLVRFQGDKVKADAVYQSIPPLTGRDVADTMLYAMNAPKNVQIAELTVVPTYQANVFIKK